jgi:hypothetical protein
MAGAAAADRAGSTANPVAVSRVPPDRRTIVIGRAWTNRIWDPISGSAVFGSYQSVN